MPMNQNRRLTWRFSFNLISAMLVLFFISHAAQADEIAIWNFNDSNLNVDRGSGTLSSNIIAANILFAAGNVSTMKARDVLDLDPNSPRRGGGIFPPSAVIWRHDPALVP